MLKELFKRRTKKYTIVVEHPLDAFAETRDAVQAHTVLVYRVISMLGYRPRQLTGGTFVGGVSARVVVRAKTDEDAVALLAAINRCLCDHSAARIDDGNVNILTDARYDYLLNEMA